jgi:hypothetical protein
LQVVEAEGDTTVAVAILDSLKERGSINVDQLKTLFSNMEPANSEKYSAIQVILFSHALFVSYAAACLICCMQRVERKR